MHYFGIAYLFGAAIGKFAFSRISSVNLKIAHRLYIIFFLIAICGANVLLAFTENNVLRLLTCMAVSILTWMVFPANCKWLKSKPNGLSFFIYLYHYFILETIEKVFWIVFGNTVLGASLDFIIAPIITIIVLEIAYNILTHSHNHLLKYVYGDR